MTTDETRAEDSAEESTSYPLRPPTAPTAPAAPAAPAGGDDGQGPGPGGQGRLLGGRYRLKSRLGHGGMGTVWRAYDELIQREIAVKEPRVPETVPAERRAALYERMHREARAAARVSHPSVITLHDVVTENGRPWLVMELVRGQSLADVLEDGTMEVRQAARVGLAVLDALAAAHEAGVTHRDVKPANVLLGGGDRVVLTDFGIAQVEGEQGLTDTGTLIGSPEFMPPERALGQRPGPQSDLWALGLLLYVAAEGVSPFRRNTAAATLQAVISAEPQPPSSAAGPLGDLITRLLDKRPSARPDAAEIRRVLTSVLAPPPAATMLTTGVAPSAPARPRFGWKGLLGVGGGVVVAAAVATLLVVRPFGGGGLPEGWEEREEAAFQMNLALPSGFERSLAEDDPDHLVYTAPDGIHIVDVWLTREDTRQPLQAASTQLDDFEAQTYSYGEADGSMDETEFQGADAAELFVTTRPEEDGPRQQRMSLFYGDESDQLMWRVQVFMPGEDGPAKEYGEQLYADLIEHLEINLPAV
ncbi:serine/threonine-protein kinase [Streptomyces sp. SBT349]|uniref:serine/threonine-protein kinase n=1 Tax=Streptomyces sp. SBT349 TaxID=1580539 RepID=UPI00069E414D|nr:serine/threonine-protein kinase [Streptomyces sp. SBT349]